VQRVQLTPVDQPPGVVASVDPLAPAPTMVLPGGTGPVEDVTADATVPPARDALDRLYGDALELPVVVARDGPIAGIDPRTVGVVAASDPVAARAADLDTALTQALGQVGVQGDGTSVQVSAPPPEVLIFAVRPSWVRVQAADDTVLFEKILDAGERYVIPRTDAPARLRAGNAGSLYFGVNGQTLGPAGQGPSVVRDVELSVTALTGRFQLADVAADADLAQHIALAQAAEPPAE
jgi:hypothetical protein